MKLIFLTGNKDKLREVQAILGTDYEIVNENVDIEEIQDLDPVAIVTKKAQEAYNIVKEPLVVEDNSLYLDAWNGLPGPLIKWFLKALGNLGFLKMLENYKNRKADAVVVAAYNNGEKIFTFEGRVKGRIISKESGRNGFGWDKFFVPDGHDRTYADMTYEEKNKISPRRLAFEKLRDFLNKHEKK